MASSEGGPLNKYALSHPNLIKNKLAAVIQLKGGKGPKSHKILDSLKERNFREILKRAYHSRNLKWTYSFQRHSESVKLHPEFLHKRLKNQLAKYQLPTLSEEVLMNIFEKIPPRLRENWFSYCDPIIDDIKYEYAKISSQIILDMTLATKEDGYKVFESDAAKSRISLNISVLKKNKKNSLSGDCILYYSPFIRKLIAEAQNLLPDVFIDCSKYSGFKGFYHPDVLLGIMEKEIDREDLRMEYDWFGKLFLHISEKDFFNDWSDVKITKFINLIIQITKTIALDRIYDTLKALLDFFTDRKTTPKIAVKTYYSYGGTIMILPTAADICSAYCKLIKRVYQMGMNFVHFEMFHIKTGRRGNITLEKYDSVREKYEQKICNFVTQIYLSLTEYYDDMSEKFRELLDDSQTSCERLSSMNMEELIATADRYIAVKGNINEMELNTYFTHFKAHNKSLIMTLLFITDCRINQIMNEVLRFHVEYCERNCEEFYKIALEAVKVPETTEELMSLAKFMSFVCTEHMESMREGIINYLEMFYRVMEIVTVSQTYLEMMGLVLGWVHYLGNVIAENAVLLQATKFEFEERLNDVTEKLNEDLENFSAEELDGLDHLDNYHMIGVYTLHIMICLRKIQNFDDTARWINKEETLFEITLSTYPELDEIKAFVNPFAKLIFQLYKWNIVYTNIMDGSLENLTEEIVESILEKHNECVHKCLFTYIIKPMMAEYLIKIEQLQKWFKSKIRQQTNENNPRRFKGMVDDSEYENWPAPLKLLYGAQQNLKEIKQYKTLISILCNPRMTIRHWQEISAITGRDMTPYKGSSLRQFINFKVEDKMDQLEVISNNAIKEYHLQENLIQMKMEWKKITFSLDESSLTSEVIIGSVDHIQSVVDDHLVKTLGLRSSAYVKPIEDELKKWYDQLNNINVIVEEWCSLQRYWLYFLPIFSAGDINQHMPSEGSIFSEVDEKYRSLLQLVKDNTLVLSIANNHNVLPDLKYCLLKIEEISASVRSYVDKKRLFFSRFFFLSDRDMLMLFSQTKDPRMMQCYLEKCFCGISKLGFDSLLNINAIYSSEEEEITLVSKVSTSANENTVEKWFVQVEDQMVVSVRDAISRSTLDYRNRPLKSWLKSWPGQIIICVFLCYWTQNIHNCFYSEELKTLEDYTNKITHQMQEGMYLLCENLKLCRRRALISFITILAHCKDVCQILWKNNVTMESDFLWISQIRYYMESDIKVKTLNAKIKYGYEYLGSPQRLVITALTERCYNILINAFQLQYGGATEGPSGTGKTETIKDLAQAVGVQCRIFNCSLRLSVLDMTKFLKGIASSGSWACFHQLDHSSIEILSVVGQQILCIVQAKRNNLAVFTFAGSTLILNPSCYICITVDPCSNGRISLPSNLKVLFRSVAMMVPDFHLIVQTILYSSGFNKSKTLSTKLVAVFRICAEQLSSQTHYDYGLRSLKAVLELASNLKLKNHNESEERIILSSLCINTLPKFVSQDSHLFKDILKDIFPIEDIPSNTSALYENFLKVCKEKNLQPINSFIEKIIFTYEVMKARHSAMIIGGTFGGKSTMIQVLSEALDHTENTEINTSRTKIQIINPKAVAVKHLFGYYHPQTEEWMDGIIGKVFREYVDDNTSDRKWILFDGPITATWAENLNTAIDENKILFLNTGEVINITDSVSIIFESVDLLQASPAVISRCGMIYVDPVSIGWISIIKSWNNTIPQKWLEDKPDRFIKLLKWLLPPCLNFIKKQCHKLADAGDIHSVSSVCQLIEMMLGEAVNGQDLKYINPWSQAVVALSVLWGTAGLIDLSSREKFDPFFKKLWQVTDDSEADGNTFSEEIEIFLPTEGLLEDYMYNFKGKGNWKYWPEALKVMKLDDIFNARNNMVTTVESLKYAFLIELMIKYRKRFLITGPSGAGKSFIIQSFLSDSVTKGFVPAFLNFTFSITAEITQELIISKLVKRTKSIYGPIGGKICIMFIDDMNMPENEVDTKPPLELLRQLFDHGHWYDLRVKEKIYIQDLFIIGAMGIENHSSQPLSPRFLRHFIIFGTSISDDSLTKIFTTTLFLGLRKNNFPADIMGTVQQIISASMYVYTSVVTSLLPTPIKYHYVFNIRDLVRAFQGFLLVKKESVDGKKVFVRLWVHEILRVFCDRLIDLPDKEWLIEKLKCAVEEQFKEEFEVMMAGLETNGANQLSTSSFSNLIFTTALEAEGNENQKYEEVPSLEQFYNVAVKAIEDFNAINKKVINIILFRFALEHLSRICRIISVPFGNGLLVGVNGSGRYSLVTLAAAMLQQDLFQPTVSKHFCSFKWRNDLKKVLKYAGTENKNCTLLLHESHLEMDYILQDMDSVLSTGEVPMLYAADEIQDILETVRLEAQEANLSVDVSSLTVFSFYINRCKRNLHIMLCLSPIGPDLRNRVRLYPALINCCTIDWFETSWTLEANGKKLETTGWPEDALERVARQYLEDVLVSDTIKEDIVNISKYFHITARNNADEFHLTTSRRVYITSTSFIDLFKHYHMIYKEKKDELEIAKEKYLGGLEKLEFAANQVEVMQKDLESLQPALKKAAKETLEMLKVIETETFEVEKASERVRNDEEIANEQAMSAMGLKTECENDLALAIPILEDAVAALNTLKPADITLVKSMKNPPETVKLVLAAVCVMKGIKPDRLPDPKNPGRKINDYWGPSKRLLGDMSFLQQLKDYDKDNIPPNIMKAVRTQYLNHKDFKPKVVAKASSAAEGLCKWVIALDKYDVVVKEVAPKKEKLKIAEKEYSETMAILDEKRNLLKGLEDKLAELKENLREANERKIRLQNEVLLCSNKLQKAQRIIGSLGGEKEKWALVSETLQKQYFSIPGDILVSCGIIVYLAPFPSLFRKGIVADWICFCTEIGIPLSESYSLVNALGSNVLIENWNINGLPSDPFSLENAIILHSSQKWPLLIDPHNQANSWIRNMEKENELVIIRFSEDNIEIILKCVQLGKPLLIENVHEQIDCILNPILEKEIFKQEDKQFLKLYNTVVEYNSNFRFYITTKLRSPNYLPDIYKKLTIINFTITEESLADKLLGIAVSKERPEMQQQRQNLMKESAKNKQDLHGVEDSILETLSSVRGNILEDENAVNILDSSKTVADQLKKRENNAKEIRVNIEKTWLRFKPIADHVAALYFTITNLASLDPMYQYSVKWFIQIFIHSINTAVKNSSIEERIKNLKDMFNYNLYVNVTHTLFDKDRILYSFLLCVKLLILENKLLKDEFDYLLGKRNPKILENCLSTEENIIQLPRKSWENICYLNNLSSFRGLVDSIYKESDLWLEFYTRYNASCEELPSHWNINLNYFQKLILLHAFRPDQFASGVVYFIRKEMGEQFLNPPPFDLNEAYEESGGFMPLIFIQSPESDSMETLLSFARTKNKTDKLRIIPLGENQGKAAEIIIKETISNGGWICLQNCHLAPIWLLTLERIIDETDSEALSPDFKFWMTTISYVKFPVSILEIGVKIIIEGPIGLKKNLLERYYSQPICDHIFYESCPEKEKAFTRLLYGITFFHSVVRERGIFGPIGWTFHYNFDECDYVTTVLQLQTFLSEYEETPFKLIEYLIGECNYGGKVQDEWDKKILKSILKRFINKEIISCQDYSINENDKSFCLPVRYNYKDFIQCIKRLPQMPDPEIYGLNKNAGVMCNLNVSNKLLDALFFIFGENLQSSHKRSNDYVYHIAENILLKIPGSFDTEKISNEFSTCNNECMVSFLSQEIFAFNHLQDVIKSSLKDLLNAIKGLTVLTPDLEEILTSLASSLVPKAWQKYSYSSLKPLGSYISDLIERVTMLQKWSNFGKPKDFWISGFYFPHSFLSAVKQDFARKNKIPLLELTFDYEVLTMKRAENSPDVGVFVYGINLIGARWDGIKKCLEEELPMVMCEDLPLLWVKPCLQNELKVENKYACPLYRTTERKGKITSAGLSTNYILPILLETHLNPSHWVTRGVALVCQMDQ